MEWVAVRGGWCCCCGGGGGGLMLVMVIRGDSIGWWVVVGMYGREMNSLLR